MLVKDHPFLRVEFDWIAVDEEGKIGFFSTAGAGPVPETALADAAALVDLFDRVRRLPDVSSARLMSVADRNVSEWLLAAKKGLHAYDWRREDGVYEIVARPDQPVSITEFTDPGLVTVAQRTRISVRLRETERWP